MRNGDRLLRVIYKEMSLNSLKINQNGNEFVDIDETLDMLFDLNNNFFQNSIIHYYSRIYPDNYNDDSIEMILKNQIKKIENDYNSSNTVYLFLYYAKKLFHLIDNQIYVDFDYLLEWDGFANKIDINIFYSAFLALAHDQLDYKKHKHESIIRNTNERLNKILNKGIAENHMHLNASGYSSEMNWYFLSISSVFDNKKLNGFVDKNTNFRGLDKNKVTKEETILNLQKIILTELFLFDWIYKCNFIGDKEYISLLLAESENDFIYYSKKINAIQELMREKMKNMNSDFTKYLRFNREFMSSIFLKILNNDEDVSKLKLYAINFYFSGISKIRFEFVQDNIGMGFSKFKSFEEEKEAFIPDENNFKLDLYKSVFDKYYSEEGVKLIEIRTGPKSRVRLIKMIKQLDSINDIVYRRYKKRNKSIEKIEYGIIIHYIKQDYNNKSTNNFYKSEIESRNQQALDALTIESKKLSNFFDSTVDKYYKNKIVAIDTANYESFCRPEIFGEIYRKHKKEVKPSNRLYFTYHVGEEYNTLSNGIRAIDEVIEFLGYSRGDRIGHGLALGQNVDNYFNKNNGQIISSLQDYIDDIAWLYQLIAFESRSSEKELLFLRDEFEKYKMELFIDVTKIEFTMNDYINSYYLRGDNPSIYYNNRQFEEYSENLYGRLINGINNEKLNFKNVKHKRAFLNYKSRILNFEYHYSPYLKKKGETIKVFKASSLYIECVKIAQIIMKKKIYDKDIFIEANPTSNKKISSVSRYIDLPFLQLNQFSLTKDSNNIAAKYPIPITINTDDSSIFQTNLHNEYSLITAALLKEGYNKEEVYRYIDYLRVASLEQNFI